jgi:hypothetical protein
MLTTTRRALILIAACWHLMLTAVMLPAHLGSHAAESHCCATQSGQLGDAHAERVAPHHSGDCQLCKLESRIQPADISASGQPLDFPASTILRTTSTQIASVVFRHFSNRAPPVGSATAVAVG